MLISDVNIVIFNFEIAFFDEMLNFVKQIILGQVQVEEVLILE